MRSALALVWTSLAVTAILLLVRSGSVDAWNRQIFNRYSRNLYRNAAHGAAVGGGGDLRIGLNGNVDFAGNNANNEIDEFNALFGLSNHAAGGGIGGNGIAGNGRVSMQQMQPQTQEVYGIVEPLMEVPPCIDRPCFTNEECCPGGVCVNTYGDEGKCVYLYDHKRDLCHRNIDCIEPGTACLKTPAGNLMCQPMPTLNVNGVAVGVDANPNTVSQAIQWQRLLNTRIPGTIGDGISLNGAGGIDVNVPAPAAVAALKQSYESGKQYGENCETSKDCNVAKSICCQLKRSHHHLVTKRVCAYFRDPFMCIDMMMPNEEENRENRYLASYRKRRV